MSAVPRWPQPLRACTVRTLFVGMCTLITSCNSTAITESRLGGAIVFGTATLNREPLSGWIVSFEGRTLSCERLAPASGRATVSPTSDYHDCVTGQMSEGSYCVRAAAIGSASRRRWRIRCPSAALFYTTNAFESLHMEIRKINQTRGHFPNDEAASKFLFLTLLHIGKKWRANPDKHWRAASPHLHLRFGVRLQDS